MRILHIGKFFPPHPGGIERFVADLAGAQVAQGMDVHVLAHAEPGSWRGHHLRHGDVDVTLVACPGQLLYAPMSPGFGWRLSRLIAQFKPDLLHLHLPNTSAFWALMIPAARRLPWIVHWHADIPLDSRRRGLRLAYRLYRPWEQALLRRARSVIATSQPYRDSSLALAPWRSKTRVISLGLPELTPSPPTASGERVGVRGQRPDERRTQTEALPLTLPSPPSRAMRKREKRLTARSKCPGMATGAREMNTSLVWPAAGLRVLAVGRLSYFKGFDVLLRALAQLPDASLVLIGDGECADSLRRLADELGIADRVNFAGRIDMVARGQAQLADAYARCDVFCLPSTERAESFGLVLLEAMRAGKATIASAIPGSGVGFVVRDGETGILVAPRDIDALVAAIRRLQEDASLGQRLGAAGKLRWLEEFTMARATQAIQALYHEATTPTT